MTITIALSAGLSVLMMLLFLVSSIRPNHLPVRLRYMDRRRREPYRIGGVVAASEWESVGRQAGLSTAELQRHLSMRPWYAAAGAIAGALLAMNASFPPLLLTAAGGSLGWWYPGWTLQRRAAVRQRQLEDDLPVFIDRLALGADAGLNVRQAFRMAAQRARGPLGELLRRTLDRMELGASLSDAFKPELDGVAPGPVKLVLMSLVQAEQLGTPLVDIAREQASFTRQMSFHRMQQMLDALPLKLTLCGVIFLFPPVFIVLLVPNLINFFKSGW